MLQLPDTENRALPAGLDEPGGIADVYVARQPILNEKQQLFGYELLYRSGPGNGFDGSDPTTATSRVIANSYLTIGLERLTGDRLAFINFDRAMLVGGYRDILPEKSVVIEVLEQVRPDNDVLDACRQLKENGHLIALDDLVCDDGLAPLIELADFIKVDFQLATPNARAWLAERYGSLGVRLLAEKVESHEEFRTALDMGYTLFQGYFFSRPQVIAAKQISASKRTYLRILAEVSHPELNFDRVEGIVRSEAQLIYQLLRYINSAGFGWKGRIRSIRHAITLLGESEFRKWVLLVSLCGVAHDKPSQLVINAVVRGRFCELLSNRVGLAQRTSELFLMGMFSLLDAVLDQPMERVLEDIHLADDVRDTLLGEGAAPRHLKALLDLARAYETADWGAMDALTQTLGVPMSAVSGAYLEAVALADRVLED